MAFLKFSRDKRGYEHFYLVQPTSSRAKAKSRLLYWFRTPPNVRVGRSPFDPDMRRALEAQNPDVEFDWAAIVATPIPPVMPDPERWRERRRAERAAREPEGPETEEVETAPELLEPPAPVEVDQAPSAAAPDAAPADSAAAVDSFAASNEPAPIAESAEGGPVRRRRRRRRGRRRTEVEAAPGVQEDQRVQEVEQAQEVQEGREIQDPEEPEEPDRGV